jgi:uncharacterized protein (TIGR03067 family)
MPRRTLTIGALAVLLFLPLLLRADEAQPPKVVRDVDGEWELQSIIRDGKEGPPPDPKPIITIEGDVWGFRIGDQTRTATVRVDADKKWIDVRADEGPAKGKIRKGVYEVKDDLLRICQADEGKDRPAEVSSKEGSGLTLITLKRVKK